MPAILGHPGLQWVLCMAHVSVPAQPWATIRGTMVRDSHGHDEPLLKVYVGLLAVGCVMGWPCGVVPVFQQPLCSLPVLAVAIVLDMGERWLCDSWLHRVALVAGGARMHGGLGAA